MWYYQSPASRLDPLRHGSEMGQVLALIIFSFSLSPFEFGRGPRRSHAESYVPTRMYVCTSTSAIAAYGCTELHTLPGRQILARFLSLARSLARPGGFLFYSILFYFSSHAEAGSAKRDRFCASNRCRVSVSMSRDTLLPSHGFGRFCAVLEHGPRKFLVVFSSLLLFSSLRSSTVGGDGTAKKKKGGRGKWRD